MFSTDLLYPTLLAHLPLSSLRLKTNKSENVLRRAWSTADRSPCRICCSCLISFLAFVFPGVPVAWKGFRSPGGPEGACKVTAKVTCQGFDGMRDRYALFVGMWMIRRSCLFVRFYLISLFCLFLRPFACLCFVGFVLFCFLFVYVSVRACISEFACVFVYLHHAVCWHFSTQNWPRDSWRQMTPALNSSLCHFFSSGLVLCKLFFPPAAFSFNGVRLPAPKAFEFLLRGSGFDFPKQCLLLKEISFYWSTHDNQQSLRY